MICGYNGQFPRIDPSVFVAPSADIIGDVVIGRDSSVWFQAVIRGDVHSIRIGERTNIQDSCVLHVRHETGPLTIGSSVTMGHGAIVHACTIGDSCLIGMGSIILDNAEINPYTLVAAGTLVRERMVVPEGMLVAGVPGRIVRTLTTDERAMIDASAGHYCSYVSTYRQSSDAR